jgi:hypothetical protein
VKRQRVILQCYRAILYAPFHWQPIIFAVYLDPNRNSLQKPIGGRSVLTQKHANSMLKTRAYLEPNSQCMQKTIEGVYTRNLTRPQKPKTRCWPVGLGDNLRGRRESVLKNNSPNLSTQRVFSFLHFPSIPTRL